MPHSSPYNARICIPCVDHQSTRSLSPNIPELATRPYQHGRDMPSGRLLGGRNSSYKWKNVGFLEKSGPAPKHRWSFASCSDGANVYIQGGIGLNESYRDFWKFNWKTKTWSEIVPNNMSTFASHRLPLLREHIMIMYKNRIYIFGGNLVDTTGLPLWSFDLLTSEWISICSRGPVYSVMNSNKTHSQVPSNLTHHSAVLYNQAIFIFGGYRHVYGVSGELWKYDIEKNTWEILYESKRNQSGPKAMFGHRAVLYNDAMFVIFGRKRENEMNNEMWKYSLDCCSWSCEKQHGQVPPNLTGAAVEVVGKRMFVVGGKTEDASFNKSVYLFSFAKRRWHKYGIDSEHTALSEATLICVPLALVLRSPDEAATEKSSCHETSTQLVNIGESSDHFGGTCVPMSYPNEDDTIKRVFFKQNSMFEASKGLESFGGLHPTADLGKLSMARMSRSITSIDDTDSSNDCHPFQYRALSSASTLFQSWESLVSPGPKSSKFLYFNSPRDSKSNNNNGQFSYDNQSFLNDSFDNPLLYKHRKGSLPPCEEETNIQTRKVHDNKLAPDKYEEALVLLGGLTKDYFPGQKSHMEILYCTVAPIIGNSSSEKIETYV